MTKTKTDPRFSAGAREERREVLAKVRREIRVTGTTFGSMHRLAEWLLGRQKRYSTRKGGL